MGARRQNWTLTIKATSIISFLQSACKPVRLHKDLPLCSSDCNNPDYQLVGTNPCQPASATLLTPNGISTMGDIKEGDLIWSSEGWTKIVRKWSTGFKDVYKYRTSRGVFVGTENHRLISEGRKIEAKDCESVDSLVGDYNERNFEFKGNFRSYIDFCG